MILRAPRATLFPYTTLFRSTGTEGEATAGGQGLIAVAVALVAQHARIRPVNDGLPVRARGVLEADESDRTRAEDRAIAVVEGTVFPEHHLHLGAVGERAPLNDQSKPTQVVVFEFPEETDLARIQEEVAPHEREIDVGVRGRREGRGEGVGAPRVAQIESSESIRIQLDRGTVDPIEGKDEVVGKIEHMTSFVVRPPAR